MLTLNARLAARWESEPAVVRISTDLHRSLNDRHREAFLIREGGAELPSGFAMYFVIGLANDESSVKIGARLGVLPESMRYLGDGDVVRYSPTSGHFSVLYRRASRFNSMLLTEQCNSYCIMCSQPPKRANDRHLAETYLQAIPLMDPETPELGITGGEPTLLGETLLEVITKCKKHLPRTALHLLSNGRLFSYLSLAQALAAIDHPELVLGIPLYSDIAAEHDFVVQASGAFDQTIRGMMNLERCGQRVELRVVLHKYTIARLPLLARYIARNLPFVEHVALMGLELMGFAQANLEALWIDPADYQSHLVDAVRILVQHQMNVSIYNHQLCTLDERLWTYARKSISDWKNEYVEACSQCTVQGQCGGFFSSSNLRRSAHIRPYVTSPNHSITNAENTSS